VKLNKLCLLNRLQAVLPLCTKVGEKALSLMPVVSVTLSVTDQVSKERSALILTVKTSLRKCSLLFKKLLTQHVTIHF